ncbi:hypothetical protein DSCW_53180 [Desulfosarcina widdelii]|uniref:Uncharacterized protein n=1 Tax=Desulfosarcina widdelii TaxID=947919 RepID=A0A5K7ZDU4_9BACT|nr:hypothetical protein DSCW_53180 [Desulfosarcina widdelii]
MTLYYKGKRIRILQYLLSRLEHVSKEANTSSEEKLESLKNALLYVYDFDATVLIRSHFKT